MLSKCKFYLVCIWFHEHISHMNASVMQRIKLRRQVWGSPMHFAIIFCSLDDNTSDTLTYQNYRAYSDLVDTPLENGGMWQGNYYFPKHFMTFLCTLLNWYYYSKGSITMLMRCYHWSNIEIMVSTYVLTIIIRFILTVTSHTVNKYSSSLCIWILNNCLLYTDTVCIFRQSRVENQLNYVQFRQLGLCEATSRKCKGLCSL